MDLALCNEPQRGSEFLANKATAVPLTTSQITSNVALPPAPSALSITFFPSGLTAAMPPIQVLGSTPSCPLFLAPRPMGPGPPNPGHISSPYFVTTTPPMKDLLCNGGAHQGSFPAGHFQAPLGCNSPFMPACFLPYKTFDSVPSMDFSPLPPVYPAAPVQSSSVEFLHLKPFSEELIESLGPVEPAETKQSLEPNSTVTTDNSNGQQQHERTTSEGLSGENSDQQMHTLEELRLEPLFSTTPLCSVPVPSVAQTADELYLDEKLFRQAPDLPAEMRRVNTLDTFWHGQLVWWNRLIANRKKSRGLTIGYHVGRVVNLDFEWIPAVDLSSVKHRIKSQASALGRRSIFVQSLDDLNYLAIPPRAVSDYLEVDAEKQQIMQAGVRLNSLMAFRGLLRGELIKQLREVMGAPNSKLELQLLSIMINDQGGTGLVRPGEIEFLQRLTPWIVLELRQVSHCVEMGFCLKFSSELKYYYKSHNDTSIPPMKKIKCRETECKEVGMQKSQVKNIIFRQMHPIIGTANVQRKDAESIPFMPLSADPPATHEEWLRRSPDVATNRNQNTMIDFMLNPTDKILGAPEFHDRPCRHENTPFPSLFEYPLTENHSLTPHIQGSIDQQTYSPSGRPGQFQQSSEDACPAEDQSNSVTPAKVGRLNPSLPRRKRRRPSVTLETAISPSEGLLQYLNVDQNGHFVMRRKRGRRSKMETSLLNTGVVTLLRENEWRSAVVHSRGSKSNKCLKLSPRSQVILMDKQFKLLTLCKEIYVTRDNLIDLLESVPAMLLCSPTGRPFPGATTTQCAWLIEQMLRNSAAFMHNRVDTLRNCKKTAKLIGYHYAVANLYLTKLLQTIAFAVRLERNNAFSKTQEPSASAPITISSDNERSNNALLQKRLIPAFVVYDLVLGFSHNHSSKGATSSKTECKSSEQRCRPYCRLSKPVLAASYEADLCRVKHATADSQITSPAVSPQRETSTKPISSPGPPGEHVSVPRESSQVSVPGYEQIKKLTLLLVGCGAPKTPVGKNGMVDEADLITKTAGSSDEFLDRRHALYKSHLSQLSNQELHKNLLSHVLSFSSLQQAAVREGRKPAASPFSAEQLEIRAGRMRKLRDISERMRTLYQEQRAYLFEGRKAKCRHARAILENWQQLHDNLVSIDSSVCLDLEYKVHVRTNSRHR